MGNRFVCHSSVDSFCSPPRSGRIYANMLGRVQPINIPASIRRHSNNNSISNSQFSPPQASSHARHYRESTPRIQDADEEDGSEQEHEQNEDQFLSPSQAQHHSKSVQQSPAHAPITLSTIFETDMDMYVACHIKQYEAERKRWAECSTEDWVHGADGEFCYRTLAQR